MIIKIKTLNGNRSVKMSASRTDRLIKCNTPKRLPWLKYILLFGGL